MSHPPRCRATTITVSGTSSWTVVDASGLPIDVVDNYLHWLRAINRSPNTVKAYARHLSLLFRWFDAYGLVWDEITFEQLCDFMTDARNCAPPLLPARRRKTRSPATMRALAAALREFYEHHRLDGRGPENLALSRSQANSSATTKHFLAHVEARRDQEVNRLAQREPARLDVIKTINFETDFERLQAASTTLRDALLLSVLYDCALRLGGALGLRHSDLDPMRKEITVERRLENANGSLSKRRSPFTVTAPSRTFDLYRRYLLEELEPSGLDSDYLFVNLRQGRDFGRPCSESNAIQMVRRVGVKAGIPALHPHMLRHTHGTALAKAGWTNAEIATRLGHAHASSADVYIHLCNDDLSIKFAATAHLIWRPTAGVAGAV